MIWKSVKQSVKEFHQVKFSCFPNRENNIPITLIQKESPFYENKYLDIH